MGPTKLDLDVVGIGALNVDYIASAPPSSADGTELDLRRRISKIVSAAPSPFQWGAETLVDERIVYAALEEMSAPSLDVTLGGSAWNAIYALEQMRLGLRLGYVGVAGRVRVPGISSLQQLEMLGIDHTFVRRSDCRDSGICLSYVDGGERTLLTAPGANVELAQLLEERFEELAQYLARTKVVHITSLLDPESPRHLLTLLRRMKRINPGTVLTFDPGHTWASSPTPEVEGILSLSDYLLVNTAEFAALGNADGGEPDEAIAARLMQRLDSPDAVVIVKRSDGVTALHQDSGAIERRQFAQTPLSDDGIQDATGAGDVFAAGLLAVIAGSRLQLELGASLGMRLAGHKLRYVGAQGHAEFPAIAQDFIRIRAAERQHRPLPQGVFISHGANPQWHAVRDFIERECKLPTQVFESHLWSSRQVTEALAEYLKRCGFAVCVLTAEDLAEDGTRRPRQNVIHEAGLFQGRYGFDRVMLLAEEGCALLPELAGLPAIRFPHGRIDVTFRRLQKMIG